QAAGGAGPGTVRAGRAALARAPHRRAAASACRDRARGLGLRRAPARRPADRRGEPRAARAQMTRFGGRRFGPVEPITPGRTEGTIRAARSPPRGTRHLCPPSALLVMREAVADNRLSPFQPVRL